MPNDRPQLTTPEQRGHWGAPAYALVMPEGEASRNGASKRPRTKNLSYGVLRCY